MAIIYYGHRGCIFYLLEHDKLILCIIPLVNLLLIPETKPRYRITHANIINIGYLV